MMKFGRVLARIAPVIALCAVAQGLPPAQAAPASHAAKTQPAKTQPAAQEAPAAPAKIHQYEYWGAYSYKAEGKTICYALSTPNKQEPDTVKHGDNFFLVSKRAGGKLAFEPQFMAGYELKPQSRVSAQVGAKSFSFFTRGNSAWVEGDKQEAELLAAMRGGSAMEVKAVSKRGTDTSYIYSLKGLSAALKAVQQCK